MRQDWSINYPQTLQNDFLALYCRYGMTPTCISAILMGVILPAKGNHQNTDKNLPIDKEIIKKDGAQNYIIFFGGNAQNCIDEASHIFKNHENNDSNWLFWNYPGVGNSCLPSDSPEDLYRAGYSVVRELMIKEQVLPENITLYGYSLGGNVASEVARRLYREEYFVHLTVDRTFSTISAVIPEKIKDELLNPELRLYSLYGASMLGMSALMLSILGLPGSIINTATLTLMNALAMTGYCIAFVIQSVGIILQEMMSEMGFEKMGAYLALPFIKLGNFVNDIINFIAESLYNVTYWIVGIVSLAAFLPMLFVSVAAGIVCGTLLSVELLWTNRPMVLPISMMIEAALIVNSCSMDTLNAMNEIMKLNTGANIHIKNTQNDDIILTKASLCEGMEFFLGANQDQQPLNSKVTCEWYSGNHIYLGTPIK
jgi:hypothetical protein